MLFPATHRGMLCSGLVRLRDINFAQALERLRQKKARSYVASHLCVLDVAHTDDPREPS
jgi:hypothetical protein